VKRLLLLCALLIATPAVAQKRIALTFDDAPRSVGAFFTRQERARRLIASLKKARVEQAAFFVNPGNVHDGSDETLVDGYVRAGHVIADHSFSHPHLNQLDIAEYLADVDKADPASARGSAIRSSTRAARTRPSATRSAPASPRAG
jgi:peptidoglycan/xylan/chitin deacetylase (PgdA/CDA1 family)